MINFFFKPSREIIIERCLPAPARSQGKLINMWGPEYGPVRHNAAMPATCNAQHLCDDYRKFQTRGFCNIAALAIIARQLAQLASSLLGNHTSFGPIGRRAACPAI